MTIEDVEARDAAVSADVGGEPEDDQRTRADKRKRRREPVPVRVLRQEGQGALVEWRDADGDFHRGFVPAGAASEGACDSADLEAALDYGARWEELVDTSGFTPERLAAELRRRGVWTAKDAEERPGQVVKAIVVASGVTAAALRRAAEKE